MQSVPGVGRAARPLLFHRNGKQRHRPFRRNVQVSVSVRRTPLHVKMVVSDDGVGIFKKISEALQLDDERHAMLELTKGKFTTDPAAHSDSASSLPAEHAMFLASSPGRSPSVIKGRTGLATELLRRFCDRNDHWDDYRVGHKNQTLNAIFAKYSSPANPGFSRTTIPVAVAQFGDNNLVSRSQAKRVLAGINRFKEVMFDFEGVAFVGHGIC